MKKLLLSTVLVAATGAPVLAQSDEVFRRDADPTELHASEFIGMRVYRTDALEAEAYDGVQESWDDIGEIHDVVFSREGSVEAVLVDIGGFLGIGENQVAVDMDSIKFVADSGTPDQEVDFFLVLNAPRGALEEAPRYGAMGGGAADTGAQNAAANDEAKASDDSAAEAGGATSDDPDDAETAAGSEPGQETSDADAPDTQTRSSGMGLAREGFVTATESDLVVEELTGALAYDTNDERIGEISELLVADDGKIQSAVVDVGGFLGIGEKPVQLDMSKLDIMRSESGGEVRVYVSMSEEELEALPTFEK